jgi:hypothetical protein
MNVDVYNDFLRKIATITLPNGKVSTKYLKANWATIISGPLLTQLLQYCDYHDIGLSSEADYIAWLKDPKNWKRGHKGKLDPDDQENWEVPVDNCVHRMMWTDEFQDGMDLNFISDPTDSTLLSIHIHSD